MSCRPCMARLVGRSYQSRIISFVIGIVSVSCSYSISTRGPAFFARLGFGAAGLDDDGAGALRL